MILQDREQIFNDTYLNKDETTFLNITNSSSITFDNPLNSSTLADEETVEQIRENAPKIFSSQLRLVTESDYEAFLNKNLANVVASSHAWLVMIHTSMNIYNTFTICVWIRIR